MNRFGTFLGLAHAAMTAEGDNSVLMQKVAKERLGEISKEGFEILSDTNNAGMEYEHGWSAFGFLPARDTFRVIINCSMDYGVDPLYVLIRLNSVYCTHGSNLEIKDVNSTTGLMKVLRLREAVLFQKLGSKMAAAGKAGVFDTWMLEESDLIQAAARAYGDRLIADRFALQNCFANFC